jgi:iron complex outermembrane receptor protein
LFRAAVPNTTLANCNALGGRFGGPGLPATTCDFPGRAAAAGAQGFPGIPEVSRTNAKRHSYAVYAELDTDPIEGLTTTLAGRYEHYSDFGSTWNGKFAARWELIRGYALRGSISNGFRAPSLHQQFFTTTSTNFILGQPVDIATLAVSAPAAVALGATQLKPEKSTNLSFGATANPLRGLTFITTSRSRTGSSSPRTLAGPEAELQRKIPLWAPSSSPAVSPASAPRASSSTASIRRPGGSISLARTGWV